MKITRCEPYFYEKAPIAEVICQLRFDRILSLEKDAPSAFQDSFARRIYPKLQIEHPATFKIELSGLAADVPTPEHQPRLFHFITENEQWRLTVCADFLALSCAVYPGWAGFSAKLTDAFEGFAKCYPGVSATRLGLRYRDVIDRDKLGIGEVPWHKLISPMLLGPLAFSALADNEFLSDDAASTFFSQTNIALDDCSLLLQGALMQTASAEKHAFLIDSDFFIDERSCLGPLEGASSFRESLDKLHTSAGDLFRRCITEDLHNALGPRKKD